MPCYRLILVLGLTFVFTMCCDAQGPLQVSATNTPPSTTTNVHSVQILNLNLFRYNAVPNVQDKTSNPPSPPLGLAAPVGGGGGAAAPAAGAAAPVAGAAAAPPAAGAPPDPLKPLEDAIAAEEMSLTTLTDTTQTLLNNAALATACFKDLQARYPQLLLTANQRTQLIYDLGHSPDCVLPLQQWPYNQITTAINQGSAISNLFVQLNVTTANDPGKTLLARHTAAQTGLQGLFTSSNASTLATETIYIGTWQQRAATTAAAPDAQWSPTVSLTCHPQWFGRTEQQSVSIFYYDMSASAPTQQTMSLFTNSCLGAVTISSGIGISTVRSSTFAFTPQTNYSVSPPTTTQVIGYAANSRVLPIYVGAMNYELKRFKSMGFDFAGGVGVGSSSAGTTSDFFIGPSFSFVRRYLFVSPAFHLTQRQTLQSGYKVGDPQGSLTSVPTINQWRYGFAITFSFPVVQSQ